MKTKNIISRVLDVLILAVIVVFLSSAGIQDKPTQGWYQQWLPDLNGSTIKDITFLDSLTGFAVTNSNTILQQYILKTTNSGDNWFINYTFNTPNSNWYFFKTQFINQNTGFAFSWTEMFKTTNQGNNWIKIDYALPWDDFFVINEDTIIGVSSAGFMGGVYRTTNGGSNWQLIWTNGSSGNPNRIYMYDKNLGFHCDDNSSYYFRKTTNGGMNWFQLNDSNFYDMKFIDTVTGYMTSGTRIKKTTDNGLNWFEIQRPGNPYYAMGDISIINKDTIWIAGSTVMFNGFPYGIILKTTNGGTNLGYQIPDTSIRLLSYRIMSFSNKNNGWAYCLFDSTGVHTKTGGNDTTYYTAINNQAITVPEDYILYQNYPNPFNQSTIIKYRLGKRANVKITIYDIMGKEIRILVNGSKPSGLYEIRFDAENLPSGIYFYRLKIDNEQKSTKKMILIK